MNEKTKPQKLEDPKGEREKNNDEANFQLSITPDLAFRQDHGIVNGVFHRVVKATGYPRRVEDGWLEAFLAVSEPYDISIHVNPSSINSTLVMLHNQIIKQTSDLVSSTTKGTPNPALQIKQGDTMKVYEALYKGEEKMFQVSVYVDNQADSLKELDLLTEKCKANLNAMLMIPETTKYRMAEGIKSMLPHSANVLNANREFLTSSLSATFPFLYPVDAKKKGVFFAHEKNTLNPLFIDFDSMSNKHFFVLGISGSGKSYSAKFLLMQHLLTQNCKVFVLDPNAEYVKLAQRMKGEVIELSKNSQSMINLFDLAGEDYGSKMLNLITVFDIITSGLSESQKGVLNDAFVQVYKKKGIEAHKPNTWSNPAPNFSELKEVLQQILKNTKRRVSGSEERSIEVLINRVKMYSKNGFFGFLDKSTQINLQKNFIDFDLSQLPNQVKQLVMFSVLELISREIKKDKKPKVILIDEGWSLLRSKEAENYVLEFIKTSRKYNASIGFITQEIEDLLRSEGGKSILNTTSTKILLKQNSSNLGLITKTLALNEKERNYLLASPKGQGLLITEHGRHEFTINASPKLHQLITTDPNDSEKETKDEKEEHKTKIDVSRGFYLKNELNEEQKTKLRKSGYVLWRSLGLNDRGTYWFYVKTSGNESPEHALLSWLVAEEIRKNGGEATVRPTVEADVFFERDGKKICFEIETGTVLNSRGIPYLQEKIAKRKQEYDKVVIVVTDRLLKSKYKTITDTETITRTEVTETVKNLFKGI